MQATEAPGWIAPIVWNAVALLITCLGVAGLGIAIADSESAGVDASMVVAFPLAFFWGAGLGAIVARFLWAKIPTPARHAMPVGCGCLSGLVGASGMIVFFVAIWPAL